ncbi:sigma 54-interacting transcriptional regulator [Pelagicoccus sp. SDUM812003]|uniref:sigma-54-dependent Fis family transcriptional regulator n=1 Tax=Pelagicoccus sp. SDUM812003 TaxID=3041267 RepID=UPI00280CD86A|nr:sigma 54-interacting transcriptional regulator [Pelagicoccus sp. SDUM812003]MDQ8202211.1 sigma 54-interacting transcriptional regulator [Pelagicoccus sp. SDUM812003]
MPLPSSLSDPNRLEVLSRYNIAGADSEPRIDRIIELATSYFKVPIGIVSIVDQERSWFVSRKGISLTQVPNEPGLCATAFDHQGGYFIPDTLNDKLARHHSLVTGDQRIRFYAAAPLPTPDGYSLGTLCLLDREPRTFGENDMKQLTSFSKLVISELEFRINSRKIQELEERQKRLVNRLQEARDAAEESEERFRDLFDEAPIAYVHEDLESRFIRANRAAQRILGLSPDEAVGTIGKTLVANTTENQARLQSAFESIGKGTDTSGVVLEMRRKDNGEQIWIEWWSKPDPSGEFTRTMFIDVTERLRMQKANERLEAENQYLQEEIRREHNFGEVVGRSQSLCDALQQVERVAPTDSTVLLEGETGTGKELVARAIHQHSSRANHALVKVNCGAISAGLVESELFGHVKGAFTGAVNNRDGRFKVADKGTLFLDEVGELPLDTQVKLLRVLQEQEFEPIGSSATIKVDVRVIAATNRDLAEEVRKGKFRQDLYYRLNVFPIRIPSLREREGDIPLLTRFFLEKLAKRLNQPIKRVSREAMRQLESYDWPGNIRELQNVLERAVILTLGSELQIDPSPLDIPETSPQKPAISAVESEPLREKPETLKEMERKHIEATLVQTGWRIEGEKGAAKALGINPSTLRSRIAKLGIKRS